MIKLILLPAFILIIVLNVFETATEAWAKTDTFFCLIKR